MTLCPLTSITFGSCLNAPTPSAADSSGFYVDDARKLATQSHYHFRVVTNRIMTAELDMRRINVRTEDDIVVDFSTG